MHFENFTDYGFWYLMLYLAPAVFFTVFAAMFLTMVIKKERKR